MTFPGNIKRDVTFPRSLLPGPIPAADRWTFQHERAHSTFDTSFFRRPFFHLLLLSPKINWTTNFWLNAKFLINYLQLSLYYYSQHKGKLRLKLPLKLSFLKLINILAFIIYFLPFNITRGNRTHQH